MNKCLKVINQASKLSNYSLSSCLDKYQYIFRRTWKEGGEPGRDPSNLGGAFLEPIRPRSAAEAQMQGTTATPVSSPRGARLSPSRR